MTTRPPRICLDANVLIAYVANEKGRAEVVESLLEDARGGQIELLTSVLSITEVAFVSTDEASDEPMDSEEAIEQLWVPASPVDVVDASTKVAREAREIIRESRRRGMRVVKPADAIHLASATIHQSYVPRSGGVLGLSLGVSRL